MTTTRVAKNQSQRPWAGARRFWFAIPALLALAAIGAVLGFQAIDSGPAADDYEAGGKVKRLSGHKLELKDGREIEFAAVRLPYDHEPYAEKSREVLTRWIDDEGVRLRFDDYCKDDDQRIVAYVYANDTFINQRLVRDGLAFVKLRAGNRRFADELLEAQADAINERKGIWQGVSLTSEGRFIAEPQRGTFHRPDCPKLSRKTGSEVVLEGTTQAVEKGMSPCGKCNPLAN